MTYRLPKPNGRPSLLGPDQHRHTFDMTSALHRRLENIAKREQVSVSTILRWATEQYVQDYDFKLTGLRVSTAAIQEFEAQKKHQAADDEAARLLHEALAQRARPRALEILDESNRILSARQHALPEHSGADTSVPKEGE